MVYPDLGSIFTKNKTITMKLFGNPQKKKNISILVNIAKINGLEESEKEVLYTIGEKNSISRSEIDRIIDSSPVHEETEVFHLQNKFDDIYDLVTLIAADGKVDEEELDYISKIKLEPSSDFNPKLLGLIIRKISYDILDNIDKEATKKNLEPFLNY